MAMEKTENGMRVLVVAEHDNSSLKQSTLSAVTAARQCSDMVDILVLGHHCAAVAEAASHIAGIQQVLQVNALVHAHQLAENAAAQIVLMADAYTHICAPATSFGRSVLPRVAALQGVELISEITRVLAPDTFERTIYAGNALEILQSDDPLKVMTVRTAAFVPEPTGETGGTIQNLEAVTETHHATFVSHAVDRTDRPELSSARIVVAGGQGLGAAEHVNLLEELADRLGAAIGASRAAVDAGFLPNDLQIGQTGKIIAPELYIGVGISGAIQHIAGIRNAKIIVAINQDADAPIFTTADYGIVGDLHALLPELLALI